MSLEDIKPALEDTLLGLGPLCGDPLSGAPIMDKGEPENIVIKPELKEELTNVEEQDLSDSESDNEEAGNGVDSEDDQSEEGGSEQDSDGRCKNNDPSHEDNNINIKKEEISEDSSSDSDDSMTLLDYKYKCKQDLPKRGSSENEEKKDGSENEENTTTKKDYERISELNYTTFKVKEEPIEAIKDIFRNSPLQVEKEKYHQQIFEQIMAESKTIHLEDLQEQYIARLREAASIEIFSCSLCNYQTINLNNLKCHLLFIHESKETKNVFRCSRCNHETSFKCQMNKHLVSHSRTKRKYTKIRNNKRFPCQVCNYKARSEKGLEHHMYYLHKERKINTKCGLCPFESEDQEVLKQHQETHRKGRKFLCYKCDYKNNNKTQVGLHLLQVHKISNEMSKRCKVCEVCSYTFSNNNLLRKHLLTHKDIKELSDSEIYKCPECDHQTKYKEHIKIHMKIHKDPEFVCEVCAFTTRHRKSYAQHLTVHKSFDEIQWFKCEVCPYKARSRKLLRHHIKRGDHSGKNLRKYIGKPIKTEIFKCDLSCPFETNNKKAYREHCAADHKVGKKYKCYECDYDNMSRLQVGIHLLNVHKIENEASKKSKICEICSLSFSNINHLKRHLISHKDITQMSEKEIYKCEICDHQTKYKRSYNLHMLVHKDPQIICDICGFATRHRKNYKNHLTLHQSLDEIKWLKCEFCPYQARNRKLMWAHMKKGDHSGNRVGPIVRNRKFRMPKPDTSVSRVSLQDERMQQLMRLNDIFPHSIF